MSLFVLFPDNHGFVKNYPFRLTTFSCNVIVLGKSVVEVPDKCLTDTGTFLINAVVARICYIPDAPKSPRLCKCGSSSLLLQNHP